MARLSVLFLLFWLLTIFFPSIFSSLSILYFPVLLILSKLAFLVCSHDEVQGHSSVLEETLGVGVADAGSPWQMQCE